MDQKTSLLINSQVPEFVREEYPQFISFLEAYYEFLENEQFANGISKQNDLTTKLKELKYVSDIDVSLTQFEEQFYNTFLSLLPKDIAVDKAFLIKNILPLYQSKGTEKSFQFLFRLLFGQEITINYPREQILRTSDGRWSVENILRTDAEIYSEYTSNGTQKTYYLPYPLDLNEIQVYINESLFEEQTVTEGGSVIYNYIIRKELQKVIFYNAPALNSKIRIVYPSQFDVTIFKNRKVTGLTSGAYALIENAGIRNLAGSNFFEFFINQKTKVGDFNNGELITVDYINSNNELIPFYLQALSDVESVQVINPGSDYSVGDVVNFLGASKEKAVAVVSSVSTGTIDGISLVIGKFGAGYQIGNNVYPSNINTVPFIANIEAIDDSGSSSSNTITYNNTDFISDLSSVLISDADYGFAASGIHNLTSVIGDALTINSLTGLGPAVNVVVSYSELTNNTSPIFVANSTILFNIGPSVNTAAVVVGLLQASISTEPANTLFKTTKVGGRSIGDVNDSGGITSSDSLQYEKWRQGASQPAGEVTWITETLNPYILANPIAYSDYINNPIDVSVADLGGIGSIKVNSGGTGYSIGDNIIFTNTEYFSGQGAAARVASVTRNGTIRRVQVTNPGQNYRKDYLPTITVDSISGANANLAIQNFMGQDAEFLFEPGDGIAGKVLSINLLNTGSGYSTKPVGDLSQSGDGKATSNVITRPSVIELPGRWITPDGLLSNDDTKLQGGNYYIDFSYVISSRVEFSKYKNIVKDLLNPSGAVNYAVYKIIETIDVPVTINIESEVTRQITGTVNVAANSYFVTGYQNTNFILANNTTILMPGTYIKVNGEIRISNSIINNTSITVSEAFTYSANDQLVTIMIPPYNSITTEYWREINTEINEGTNFLITEANTTPSIN